MPSEELLGLATKEPEEGDLVEEEGALCLLLWGLAAQWWWQGRSTARWWMWWEGVQLPGSGAQMEVGKQSSSSVGDGVQLPTGGLQE